MWDYILKNPIDLQKATKFGKDIAAGMSHLHAEGIIHRDLAARNLLLSGTLSIKISDFGLARVLTQPEEEGGVLSQKTKSNVGPVRWMAPECIGELKYSTKSDVWA